MFLFDFIICSNSVVVNGGDNNWSSTFGMLGQFFFLIIIFVIILFLAYLSTKWIARAKISNGRNRNLHIIESVSVGIQGTVQLVKAGERFFLIGVTKEKITFLSEVDNILIEDEKKVMNQNFHFENFLNDYFSKRKK